MNESVVAVAGVESEQAERLGMLEERIKRSFRDMGEAFGQIRDEGLYKARCPSWEAYLQENWRLSLAYGNRLIQAAHAARDLPGPEPTAESQVRPLLKLPEHERAGAWEAASEKAGGVPTQKQVQEEVEARTAPIGANEGWEQEGPESEVAIDPDVAYPVRAKLSPPCKKLFDKEVAIWQSTREPRDNVKTRAQSAGVRGLHGPVSTAVKMFVAIPHPNGGEVRGEGRHASGWMNCASCFDEGAGWSTGQVDRQACPSCGGYGFHVPFARADRRGMEE